MEVIFDKDTSFFNITSSDLEADESITKLINKDVISLTIKDELGKHITGSLTLNDSKGVWSKILRSGRRFEITYGYKGFGSDFRELSLFSQNPDELLGSGERSGLKAFGQSPSGTFGAGGNQTYTLTFYGDEFNALKSRRVFESGTRSDVIKEVMFDLGVADTDVLIDFATQKTNLSSTYNVRQWETDFRFLLRKAEEWQTLFHIGYKPSGEKIGLFIDHNKYDTIKTKNFIKGITGAVGSKRTMFYNAGTKSNVISGSWKQNIGDGGNGDGVSVVIINGKSVIIRKVIKDQKVTTWVLNEKLIEDEITARDNITDKLSFSKELLSRKDFKSVERFFTQAESSTAPQGLGFEIDLKMYGDPLLTVPVEIIFKENFPPILTQTQNSSSLVRFFIMSATHTLSKNGYKTDIKVGDTHAIGGTFLNTKGLVQ